MSNPTFEDFINRKIREEPEIAEQNLALLDMYNKGFIEVSYDGDTDDFYIRATTMGKEFIYCNIAKGFVPGEA